MENRELLRSIPKIDEMLQDKRLFFFMEDMPRQVVVEAVRETIDEIRSNILSGKQTTALSQEDIIAEISAKVSIKNKKSLRRVINATGVILHTNLGRANLSKRAVEAVNDICRGYSNLEYDVKKGVRGSRHNHVERLITKITGAQAAMVVNNNAAATMICLSAMAKGKEVIVSRGELVEIGGSFRIPEIMQESGAILKEVGATNKTKVSDYEKAYKEDVTGAIMKVHTSNYRIVGFTQEATLTELVEVGEKLNLPVIYDMGSGLLFDLKDYGVDEPTVLDALKTGIDVILFSGDKLLGGPQGGIIAGKKEYIDLMKENPLARAFRVDKMTLAAMEATFFEYLDIKEAKSAVPTLEMITVSPEILLDRANTLAAMILDGSDEFEAIVEACKGQVGGGTAPTVYLDGYAVALKSKNISPEKIERLLRKADIPIIVRISHDNIYLDVRTISDLELPIVAKEILAITEVD